LSEGEGRNRKTGLRKESFIGNLIGLRLEQEQARSRHINPKMESIEGRKGVVQRLWRTGKR
jgi:hypothetical protein